MLRLNSLLASALVLMALVLAMVSPSRVAAGAIPTSPPSYSTYNVTGVFRLPYANVNEVFSNQVQPGMTRVSYYNGLDTYIYRPDLSKMWQVNPIVGESGANEKLCFENDGAARPLSFIPDLTNFTLQAGLSLMDGHQCWNWQLETTNYGRVGKYNFYVDVNTNNPVHYSMVGYDSLIGSHFDDYEVSYTSFEVPSAPFDPSLFAQPAAQCYPIGSLGPSVHNAAHTGTTSKAHSKVKKALKSKNPKHKNNKFHKAAHALNAHATKLGSRAEEVLSHALTILPHHEHARFFPGSESHSSHPSSGSADGHARVSKDFEEFLSHHHPKTAATLAHSMVPDRAQALRKREATFQANRHRVAAHQRKFRAGLATYQQALNRFADVDFDLPTSTIPKGRLRSAPDSYIPATMTHQMSQTAIPDTVDWRLKGAVSSPLDQAVAGTCYDFASTGAIQSAHYLRTGQMKQLSQQQVSDCSWRFGNNGADGGLDYQVYEWIMSNGGVSFYENYGPYLSQDGICNTNASRDIQLSGYVNVTQNVEGLNDALSTVGPLSVSIDASHSSFVFYSTGVYYEPLCKNGVQDLDHSVLAIGYGTDPTGGAYTLIMNSWSNHWGDQGYVKMSQKDNNCGVATAPTYPILA